MTIKSIVYNMKPGGPFLAISVKNINLEGMTCGPIYFVKYSVGIELETSSLLGAPSYCFFCTFFCTVAMVTTQKVTPLSAYRKSVQKKQYERVPNRLLRHHDLLSDALPAEGAVIINRVAGR